MKRTARIAWSGMLGAVSLVCLLLSVFPIATYALPALAGVFLMPVVVECGKRWAAAVYVSVALLALLLVSNVESKLLFVAFFGYYPIVKAWAEVRSRAVEWLCKLGLFNAAVVAMYAVLGAVGFSFEEFALPGVPLPLGAVLALFLLAGNLIFVMYDIGLTRLLPLYFHRIRPLFNRLFR